MARLLLRMLNGAILGALLCLAVGAGVAGVALLIGLPSEHPMDRWYTAGWVAVIAIVSSVLVGLIAGAASRVSEYGLPLLKSAMVVAVTGVIAIAFAPSVKSGRFLLAPLGGVIVGGIVVVLAGIVKTRCTPRPTQENNTANKA